MQLMTCQMAGLYLPCTQKIRHSPKLLWLALRNITADWSRAAHDWKAAMNQFAILYEDRFTRNHL
jgi:transposase-like protein